MVGRGLRVEGWSVGSIRVGFVIKTRDLGSGSITVILVISVEYFRIFLNIDAETNKETDLFIFLKGFPIIHILQM